MCDDQQPEFRSLSEFYIIHFLHRLKIVENTLKLRKKTKTSVAKAMRPFSDSDVPAEPISRRPLIDV